MEESIFPEFTQNMATHEQQEKKWIAEICKKVEEYLEKDPNLLFSYLYRLDIAEEKIQQILLKGSGATISNLLAEEIWRRQKERIQSKKNTTTRDVDPEWQY